MLSVRRHILKAKTYASFSPDFRSRIDALREQYRQRIEAWVAGRTKVGEVARLPRAPDQPTDLDVAVTLILEVSRGHMREQVPIWGAFKGDDDQKHAQRELIAFEVSFLQKARNPQPYNHEKHKSDYNDYWLCGYCGADYTLVTTDDRLRKSLLGAGCAAPRLMNLHDGLALAESWLAGR